MRRSEFKTDAQRQQAARARRSDAAERYRMRQQGDDVPNTPEGIARWWKQRGR